MFFNVFTCKSFIYLELILVCNVRFQIYDFPDGYKIIPTLLIKTYFFHHKIVTAHPTTLIYVSGSSLSFTLVCLFTDTIF